MAEKVTSLTEVKFFFGRMDFRKDTDRMVILCQNTGFRYMTALLINAFCRSTLGAVPDRAERFNVISVRLYNIRIIRMDDRLIGNLFTNSAGIRT